MCNVLLLKCTILFESSSHPLRDALCKVQAGKLQQLVARLHFTPVYIHFDFFFSDPSSTHLLPSIPLYQSQWERSLPPESHPHQHLQEEAQDHVAEHWSSLWQPPWKRDQVAVYNGFLSYLHGWFMYNVIMLKECTMVSGDSSRPLGHEFVQDPKFAQMAMSRLLWHCKTETQILCARSKWERRSVRFCKLRCKHNVYCRCR